MKKKALQALHMTYTIWISALFNTKWFVVMQPKWETLLFIVVSELQQPVDHFISGSEEENSKELQKVPIISWAVMN